MTNITVSSEKKKPSSSGRLSDAQRAYLERGIRQPGGKLPLFGADGSRIKAQTIRSCIEHGWCEPWYSNPVKPDWLVCRLTEIGNEVLGKRTK